MIRLQLQYFAADAHCRIKGIDEPIEQATVEASRQGVTREFGLRDGTTV